MCHFSYSAVNDLEFPEYVIRILLHGVECHFKEAVHLSSGVGPVLVTHCLREREKGIITNWVEIL